MRAWTVFFLLTASSPAMAADYYRINDGSAANIREHGRCYRIANDSGEDLFVPTNTSSEWSDFRSEKPSGVTISDCQYTANCVASDTNDGCTKTVSCTGASAGEEVKRIKARCNGDGNSNYSTSVHNVAWNRIVTENDAKEDYNDWCRIDDTSYAFSSDPDGQQTSTIASSSLGKSSFSISCRDIDHSQPGDCSIYVVYECAP